jgi:hypothetical protein
MAKPLRWFLKRLDDEFGQVQTATDRMVFENRNIEPCLETRRCILNDSQIRKEANQENVIRQGAIARYAYHLADYHEFCERTLAIDPNFRY